MTDKPNEPDRDELHGLPDVWLNWADVLLKLHGPEKATREARRYASAASARGAEGKAAMWDAVAYDLDGRTRRPSTPAL